MTIFFLLFYTFPTSILNHIQLPLPVCFAPRDVVVAGILSTLRLATYTSYSTWSRPVRAPLDVGTFYYFIILDDALASVLYVVLMIAL